MISKLAKEFEKSGYKTNITLEPRANPLVSLLKGNKKTYITTCEVWKKPSKYPNIVFSGISPIIQKLIKLETTYVVIIDFKPSKPKFIFVKADSTNYRYNRNKQLIFHFKRPEYGGFFHTEDLTELTNEIQRAITG